MQHFYNTLCEAKDGRTIYHSFLTQLMQASRAEIKRVNWGEWGP